jgi:hypothetical protein
MASRAMEARGGISHEWCWMALMAIVRWFGGHRTWFRWSIDEFMDVFVVSCAWKSTVLSQKMTICAAHFFKTLTKWSKSKLRK